MRDIDHESRIAARRSFAHLTCIEYDDPVAGAKLKQAAGGGKTGKARADDHPVRRDVAFQAAGREGTFADRLPARDAVFDRQTFDGPGRHLTVSSTERSDMSIQIVLSSQ
ncbi:hypothetical protein D3C86_1647090 [compost metagenome]